MLLGLLLAICVVGSTLALEENEWRDTAVGINYNITKYFEQHDYDKLLDLFYDGAEQLYPDGPPVEKGDMKPLLEKLPYVSEYIAFLELLYSCPDVAVTRQVGYRKLPDGTVKKFRGLVLLVQENGKVRVKMGAYNTIPDYSD